MIVRLAIALMKYLRTLVVSVHCAYTETVLLLQ